MEYAELAVDKHFLSICISIRCIVCFCSTYTKLGVLGSKVFIQNINIQQIFVNCLLCTSYFPMYYFIFNVLVPRSREKCQSHLRVKETEIQRSCSACLRSNSRSKIVRPQILCSFLSFVRSVTVDASIQSYGSTQEKESNNSSKSAMFV